MGPFTVTPDRETVSDFTLAVHTDNEAIMTVRPGLQNDVSGFLKPFTSAVRIWEHDIRHCLQCIDLSSCRIIRFQLVVHRTIVNSMMINATFLFSYFNTLIAKCIFLLTYIGLDVNTSEFGECCNHFLLPRVGREQDLSLRPLRPFGFEGRTLGHPYRRTGE